MASFSIQFHATPAELCGFVRDWLSAHDVSCAAVTYQPYAACAVGAEDIGEAIEGGVRRIVLAEQELALDVTGNTELLDRNPGLLVLELGQQTDAGLDESHLSTTQATATWKAIARALRRATRAGATAVNEATGAAAPARTHRYTEGAYALWESGTRMRTAGSVVMRLSESRDTGRV
jgi:hypothetical protein